LQEANDVMGAHRLVKQAYNTDVSPILAEARRRKGGALHPWACYRASGYRAAKAKERPQVAASGGGIV
jgi:L-rhamnose isomerase/sugar isomerase